MILQKEESGFKKETAQPSYEWPQNYYAEPDPLKRKELLDAGEEADDEIQQMRRLFERRYEPDKKGNYADTFLRSLLELKVVSLSLDAMFAQKKNRKAAQKALEHLGLTGEPEFPEHLLYRELCHVAALYIQLCAGDKNYTAILWGFGKISDRKIVEKIDLDLRRIAEAVPQHLEMEAEFRILQNAILDTKKEYLEL